MTLRRLLAAALAGFGTCGLWIAALTIEGNPELLAGGADAAALAGWFVAVYAGLGVLAALAAAAVVALVRRAAGSRRAEPATRLFVYLLAVAPVAGALLLPDSGLHRTLLTNALFGGATRTGLLAAAAVVASALAGWLIDRFARGLARRGVPVIVLPAVLWLALIGWGTARLVTAGSCGLPDEYRAAAGVTVAQPFSSARAAPRVPLVLLCIDGADPDDALEPLIAAGELPTFEKLKRQGVSGELATLYPTLSPAIWTTIATGKPPAEHGVHHFVLFDLPGLDRPVRHFPLHTGLNFRVVSAIERLPGAPAIQVPYSSNLRRARALWQIAGERMRVGVYGWRVTWPAEEVDGFNVATGVTLLDELTGDEPAGGDAAGAADAADDRSVYPPDALRRAAEAAPEVSEGGGDDTVAELVGLIAAYRPEFVAAGFYSVDAAQHRSAGQPPVPGLGLPDTVVAAYRRADARLGELLAALGGPGDFNVVVVSDHGFDFEHHHHTHAPPGIFFARGPAFRRNKPVRGLSVYDIAPMVLYALDLPLAADMPGTASRRYRRPIRFPVRPFQVPTYERGGGGDSRWLERPDLEETKRRLRALGYLH